VAIIYQSSISGAGTWLRERQRRGLGTPALLIATLICGFAVTAPAQDYAALPTAPSALVAAVPARSMDQSVNRGFERQTGNSGVRFAGDVTVEPAFPGPLPLSLDDAIDRGLKHNLQILLANQTERAVQGQISTVFYQLLPNLKATA
jgi:outer membrane protein TolC